MNGWKKGPSFEKGGTGRIFVTLESRCRLEIPPSPPFSKGGARLSGDSRNA